MTLHELLPHALVAAIVGPALSSLAIGLGTLLSGRTPSERTTVWCFRFGLWLSLLSAVVVAVAADGAREVDFGPWFTVGSYTVPLAFLVDPVALAFSLLAAALTTLVARFSLTYLHKERGFLRFYVLLGIFATGTQLIAYAGALDLMFLGWELVGLSSALFIGFFHERPEPVRASIRAFATYRFCDAGFLFAIVVAHEMLGTTRLTALQAAANLPEGGATALALLFLLAAAGKSAQLPFSGWLPRAMEGPTPSSALFYGGISVHAGLYLLLRVWPVMDLSPVAEAVGVVVGLSTAFYAAMVVRASSDAKGALAHATLAQVGLILAEISLGLTALALAHLVGHALLRVWQYLRAPNMIHDAHRTHLREHRSKEVAPTPLRRSFYAAALFRLRFDERFDRLVGGIVSVAEWLDGVDVKLRGLFASKPPPLPSPALVTPDSQGRAS